MLESGSTGQPPRARRDQDPRPAQARSANGRERSERNATLKTLHPEPRLDLLLVSAVAADLRL